MHLRGNHAVSRRPNLKLAIARLAEISPNPYVLLDTDLRLVWMNDAYLKVTMRNRADITGKTMFEAFPSDPQSESYRQLKDSLDTVLQTGATTSPGPMAEWKRATGARPTPR